MNKTLRFICIVTLLGLPGIVLFAVGVKKLVELGQFLSKARVSEGRVVSVDLLRSDDDGSTHRLLVEYSSFDGTPRQFSVEARNQQFSAGQKVEVLHTQGSQGEARVRGIDTTWGMPLAFSVVGLAWASFAASMLVIGLRPQASSAIPDSESVWSVSGKPPDGT